MGKRSRKRATGPVRTPQVAPAPRPSERRRPGQSRVDRFIEKADARPKPPWHPFPLVELSVLVGLALMIFGAIKAEDRQGRLAIVFGLVLASLAGLETAVRDHFTGFRSHSALLAAFPAVGTAIAIAVLAPAPYVVLLGAVVVFAVAFWALRSAFKKRAGVGFKV